MGHVTWPRPFQGRFVIRRLWLAMFNRHIKFEMSTITCNKEMKGSANWTFVASANGWGAMSGYWLKLWCSKRRWVTLRANFRGNGVIHQRLLVSDNWSPWAITWRYLRDPTFSHFDTILACDWQTHRHTTTANTHASLALHG